MRFRLPQGPRRAGVRIALQLGALALGVHLLLPQLAGLSATGRQIAKATWYLPIELLVLETASLVAYAGLVGAFLTAAGRPAPRGLLLRIITVGYSLGRALPGGAAAALAVTIRGLRRVGVDGVTAASVMASSGLLSSAVLAALMVPASVLAGTTGRPGALVVSAAVVALVVLVAAALVPVVVRRPHALADRVDALLAPVLRGPLRTRVNRQSVHAAVVRAGVGIGAVARDRRTLGRCTGWALANWLLDIAVLAILAETVGEGTPVRGLLLAYVVAQLASSIPLTPGGVGFVETAMIGVLVTAGAPAAAATATVLGWRLVSHWLPIIAGLVLLPSVRGPEPAEELSPDESSPAPA